MKKAFSVFLALCLLLCFPVLASAEEADWQDAYPAILREKEAELRAQAQDSWIDTTLGCGYTLYDIDKDGVPELMTKLGTCEADYHGEIYSFRDGQVVCACGELGLGHSSYYSDPDENGIVLFGGHMGYAWAQRLSLEGNSIRSEDLYEDDLNARLQVDPEAEYVYPGDVIPGSVYLPLFRMELRLPLEKLDEIEAYLAGRFPGAAADVIFTEEELALYENFIASSDEVVAVSADGYTNSPGPIGFQDLLRQDVAMDYMSGNFSIQSAQPADLNGDGKPEYVLFLSTADGNSRLCCCLNAQDGRIYAYLLSYYAPDAAVDSNGSLYFAAEYYQELYRLVFDGEEAFSLMLPLEYYMP
ncbi:MAG: hypothetical protein J6P58_07510 [Oscillospiraceae bacterium]|nr:hypothetical protein [Oscillospiraceae bacterium]